MINNLTRGEKWFFFGGVPAVATGVFLALFFLASTSGSVARIESGPSPTASASPAVQNLAGDWVADNNGIRMVATVKANTIKIVLKSNDTSVDFWDGTFESQASSGATITSVKQVKDEEIVISSGNTKTFEIGDGTMVFDMSFLGVTKTITATHV